MSKILRNVTGGSISVGDTGETIASGASYTIPPINYPLWASSSDAVTYIGAGSLVVNDGSTDLSISYGIDLIKGIFPSEINIRGQLDDTSPTVPSEDSYSTVRITAARAAHINLRNNAGTEVGTASAPVRTDPTGSTIQPVNGTVAATQSGTWTVQQGTPPWQEVGNIASGSSDSGNPVKTGGVFNTTQPTVTTGQRVDTQMTARGAEIVATGVDPFDIRNVTGTVSLPTGAATAANQATEITSLQIIDDAIGSKNGGTAGTQSFLAGGVYNSTAPVLTNTQQASHQLNSSGALLVDGSTASGVPMINRQDVSTTVSATGNSSTFDTAGFLELSALFKITAISGTGAYIQFHLQGSDNGTDWVTQFDSARLTATGTTTFSAMRQHHRYYRYTWDVAGTTPSVTFTVQTTLKSVQVNRKAQRFFYADLDLTTNGNMSSTFTADDCKNVVVVFTRGADGGNNGTVQMFASIDGTNWFSVSGNLAANVSSSNTFALSNQAYPFYNLQVTAKTSAGTRVLDIQWRAN